MGKMHYGMADKTGQPVWEGGKTGRRGGVVGVLRHLGRNFGSEFGTVKNHFLWVQHILEKERLNSHCSTTNLYVID